MTSRYHAFGLHLASNRPLPGLPEDDSRSPVDLQIDWARTSPSSGHPHRNELVYESALDPTGHCLRIWKPTSENHLRWLYSDGAEFWVDLTGRTIRWCYTASLTFEDAATYLLGPVLGFILRRRGTVCLHGATICVGERAFALVGPGGAGKSTVAAALSQSDCRILHDDIAALAERGRTLEVLPGYPRLRLWPSSAQALFGSSNALPRITPNNPDWDKCYLDLAEYPDAFTRSPSRLAAVYFGQPNNEYPEPTVEPLTAARGMIRLVANVYMSGLGDDTIRAREFDVLSRLANEVPLRQIKCPNGIAHLQSLCDVLLKDFDGLRDNETGASCSESDGTLLI